MKNQTNTLLQQASGILVTLLLTSLFTPAVLAQSIWTGNAGTTNWNTPGNWTGGVPAAGKTVIIYQCTTCPVINTTGNEASFVQVYGGGKLTIGTGSLSISNPGGPGMKTQTNSQVNVSTGASLTIQNFWGEGLSVQGAFNNNGTVTINGGHTGVSVVSGGAFANGLTGSLSISGSTLNYGLVSEGVFNNQNILNIDDANNDGINLKWGTMNLGGTVNITRTGVNSIFSKGTVNISGTVNIDNGLNGIYLIGGTINNGAAAKLTIGGSTFLNDGIFLDPGTFNNNGELTINNALSKGMEISSASTFNNFNKITLNVPAWAGIFNVGGSNFTNKPCALITSTAAVVNYANFTNKGIMYAPNGGGTSINVNHGTLLGNLTAASGNAPITEQGTRVWTGCASTDWSNVANWYPSTGTQSVVQNVSQASGNAPVVNGTVGTLPVILHSGANLTVAGVLNIADPYFGGGFFEARQGATMTILASGTFRCPSISMPGGTILNSGMFEITSPFHSVGTFEMNGGKLINQAGGKLNAQIGQYGAGVNLRMNNSSVLENNGTININGIGSIGMDNSTMTNKPGGAINIGSNGMLGKLLCSNNATVQNQGNLALYGFVKIENASMQNSGQISATQSMEYGIVADHGTLGNTGGITVSGTTYHGIYLLNGGSMTNSGTINMTTIGQEGIKALEQTTVNNLVGGTITINGAGYGGINFSGNVTNSGTMDFSNLGLGGIGHYGLKFTNTATGVIKINEAEDGVGTTMPFENAGSITISNIRFRGFTVTNTGTFSNLVGGTLNITKTKDVGFINFGNFSNAGRIEIRNTNSAGLSAVGPFENKATGVLIIDQVPSYYGLLSWNTVKNYGAINISNCGNEGLAPLAHFENFATGVITIQQNLPSAWPGISNSLTFVNSGVINLQGNNQKSLTNNANASMINRPCAVINHNGLIINNGVYSNQGLLISTYAGTNSNSGTFTNTGVIEDFNNSFNGVAITNSAYRIRPINGTVGSIIYNAIEAGGTPPIVIGSTWYKDQALTQPAGTFNSTMNSFTPTVGVGTHTLYFTVKDIPNNCIKTVSIKVSIANALIGSGEKAKPDIVLFNYPNPFVNETRIKLSVPFDATGKLVVYDQFGRLVSTVYEGELSEGELYEFSVDANTMQVANYIATLVLDSGRTYTTRLVKADNF